MIERGMVTELEGRLATVQLEATESCEACNNSSCKSKRQAIMAWNRDSLNLEKGRTVDVEVDGKTQLEGALWVLGLPLALFALGYLALRALVPGPSELPAALGGVGGLALGMLVGVAVQKRKRHESLPRVLRVVDPEAAEDSAN